MDFLAYFLILIAVILFVAEFTVFGFGLFILVGIIAFFAALGVLTNIAFLPAWFYAPFMLVSYIIIGIFCLGVVTILMIKSMQREINTGLEGFIGRKATILKWNEYRGRIQIDGENWRAYSDEAWGFKPGETVLVAQCTSTELEIKPMNNPFRSKDHTDYDPLPPKSKLPKNTKPKNKKERSS